MAKKTTTTTVVRSGHITLDELDPVAKDRVLVEAQANVRAEMEEKLQLEAKKAVTKKVESAIREKLIEGQKRRILALMNDLAKAADRFDTYLVREITERRTLEELTNKHHGLVLTRQQRMTVMGLIASIGYQLTCRDDGEGGSTLQGRVGPNNRLMGFVFKDAVEVRKDYAPRHA